MPQCSTIIATCRRCAISFALALALALEPVPADAMVVDFHKISAIAGDFTGTLDAGDLFGWSVAPLGDLDGDTVPDVAVGSLFDDDGGTDQGAVWVLFLMPDGSVKSFTKISETSGGFTGALDPGDYFGTSLAPMGDLDGDGVMDLAVGAYYDDDGDPDQGAVWILFLETDGTVKSSAKISETSGGFTGTLDSLDWFGWELAQIGDLDKDGVPDLAVAADGDDDGGFDHGAFYVLFMKPDGTVKASSKVSDTAGGFPGALSDEDFFGASIALIGDLDGDMVFDLAVGEDGDDDGGSAAGAVWILFMKTDGTVKAASKINDVFGGFAGPLDPGDTFGISAAGPIGDLTGDGILDLAVGAFGDDDGGPDSGAVWILGLTPGGTVSSSFKISASAGMFPGPLEALDSFGMSAARVLGDVEGDGFIDLIVGAVGDDDGASSAGAVWLLSIAPFGMPPTPTPPLPSPTATPTSSPTPTPSPALTPSPTSTPSETPTPTALPTPSETPSATATASPTPTATPPPSFACPETPATGCTTAPKSKVSFKGNADPARRKLVWKWTQGSLPVSELGDPLATTSYSLCVYEDGVLTDLQAVTPPGMTCDGKPCWKAIGQGKGFLYKNKAGNDGGLTSIKIKSGTSNALILVKGKGAALALPVPVGVDSAVRVQLLKSTGSECWEATFASPAIKSTALKFIDKTP